MPTSIPITNTLALVAFFVSLAYVFVTWIRATHPRPVKSTIDLDARAIAQRAIIELCVVREEISKLRSDTARDRDETRAEITTQGRAIVGAGQKAEDAMRESSKLSMMLSQKPRGM